MNKKLFALLTSVILLFSLTACNRTPSSTENTTPPTTTPAKSEPGQLISHVRWLVDGYVEEVDCQYNEATNTLYITGDGFYPVEVLFFEGTQQVQKQTVRDEDGQIYTQQEYDEAGKLVYEQDDYGYRRFYEYDGKLLIRETIYENGDQPYSVKVWTYDDAGREIDFTEEVNGGEISEQIRHTFDKDGNLVAYRLDSTYEEEHWYQEERYTYQNGRLTTSTHEGDDPATCWDYSVDYYYDEQGNKVGALRQDADYGQAEDQFTYDSHGRLICAVEHYQSDGWVVTLTEYGYDEAGRLIREHYQEGDPTDDTVYFWNTTTYAYNSQGKLTETIYTSSDDELRAHYNDYNSQGNLIQSCDLIDGEELLLQTYTYDSKNNLVRIDIGGAEVLSGEKILFVTGEEEPDRYIVTQYGDTTDAREAASVNEFILQYIRTHY